MTSSLPYPEGVHDSPAARRTGSRKGGVLTTLRRAPTPLTVPEIAEAAGCAAITVRRHLKALLREGAVARVLTSDGVPRRRPRLAEDGRRKLPSRGRDQYTAA